MKTVYDPSPVGFHIPCGATFKGFSKSNGGTWDNGYTWDNNFFQAAGYRYRGDGGIYNVGNNGGYWSAASHSNANSSYFLHFNSDKVEPSLNNFRSFGFSVRPVARP